MAFKYTLEYQLVIDMSSAKKLAAHIEPPAVLYSLAPNLNLGVIFP